MKNFVFVSAVLFVFCALVGCGGGGGTPPQTASANAGTAPPQNGTISPTQPSYRSITDGSPDVIFSASAVIPSVPQQLPLNLSYGFQKGARYSLEVSNANPGPKLEVSFSPAVRYGPDFSGVAGFFPIRGSAAVIEFDPLESGRQDLKIQRYSDQFPGEATFNIKIKKLADPAPVLPPHQPSFVEVSRLQFLRSIQDGETQQYATPQGYGYRQGSSYQLSIEPIAGNADLSIFVETEGGRQRVTQDNGSGIAKQLIFSPPQDGRYDIVVQSRRGSAGFVLRVLKQ